MTENFLLSGPLCHTFVTHILVKCIMDGVRPEERMPNSGYISYKNAENPKSPFIQVIFNTSKGETAP